MHVILEYVLFRFCFAQDHFPLKCPTLFLISSALIHESENLGRFVNDEHVHPSYVMMKVMLNNTPHMCLFAGGERGQCREPSLETGNYL